ncbi:speriolin-like protein [Osmerus eperlanus]|uniref:speriolin-like protein n=1 Tax=Osmerus eperlanus TaxID=29151 RepID=UPI002E14ABAB
MDTVGGCASVHIENEKLRQENGNLKIMLGLVRENQDLRSKVQNSTLTSNTLMGSTDRKTTLQWYDSLNEDRFRDDLHQSNRTVHKTSSPIAQKSLNNSSMFTDPSPHEDRASSSYTYRLQKVTDQERLVGEIAFQLDRRILSHVFQGQARLYGFTVLNIRDKIIEVTTHPMTGKVNENHQLQLSQRHAELMSRLNQLGYCSSLHPPFTEFIINTYGILKQRPNSCNILELGFNNPDYLRKIIIDTTPSKLLKDLLLLLTCLCYMARQDGKPLFLW